MYYMQIKKWLMLGLVASLPSCGLMNDDKQQSMSHLSASDLKLWPKITSSVQKDDQVERQVADILSTMTIEQKVAQMIQPEIRDISVEDMRRYGFGAFLNGGGSFPNDNKQATPQEWIVLAEALYQASIDDSLDGSTIPTMWGTDAVHGHNNVVGATLFPHNIGLGAANNPYLIEQIATATAKEVLATGIDWVFAPTVAVVRNDRWGRTYEGYSEDPEIVRKYSAAIVRGLQGTGDDFLSERRVISTVKHFVGDGGTVDGEDQGNNIADGSELFTVHAQGYVGGLTAGAQTVMASFNSWHGKKIHGNQYLLTDVLKTKMGFDGFVVGDWNGHGQVKGCSNESCPQAINAGLDMFMAPTSSWKPLYENTIKQVKTGEIAISRINDAVTRILRVKVRAGLFDKPSPAQRPLAGSLSLIGADAHRKIARQAVRESLVLLKNNDNLLPLSPKLNILVTGDGADNIGKQSGGWTITWQGTGNQNQDFPGGTSIYQGIKAAVEQHGGQVQLSNAGQYDSKPDVAIVVFGEEPYAEGVGDIEDLHYQKGTKSDLKLLRQLQAQGIKTVSIFISGRPLWVNPELNASDAFVAAWLPGSEGAGVADVIIAQANGEANYDFTGKLSFSWPKTIHQTTVNRFDGQQALLPYGFGLQYGEANILTNNLDVSLPRVEKNLDSLAIYVSNIKEPWFLTIRDEQGRSDVSSGVVENAAIYSRTIDKNVQEDARLVNFKGMELGALEINSKTPRDLSAYASLNTVLTFAVNPVAKPTTDVRLKMACTAGCNSTVNLTETLMKLAVDQWQTVSIDLACFTSDLTELAEVTSPFILETDGQLQLKIADIRWLVDQVQDADIGCQ